MNQYVNHFIKWITYFPISFGCAILSIIFAVLHITHNIPSEWFVTNFFNEHFQIYFWLIVLIPFGIEIVKIIQKKRKYSKRYLTDQGTSSYNLFLDEIHIPTFYVVDFLAIFTVIVTIMSYTGIAIPREGFDEIYFFEKFFSMVVVPFISFVLYFLKVERENPIPNKIISNWK